LEFHQDVRYLFAAVFRTTVFNKGLTGTSASVGRLSFIVFCYLLGWSKHTSKDIPQTLKNSGQRVLLLVPVAIKPPHCVIAGHEFSRPLLSGWVVLWPLISESMQRHAHG
jgi:hypothetical protein